MLTQQHPRVNRMLTFKRQTSASADNLSSKYGAGKARLRGRRSAKEPLSMPTPPRRPEERQQIRSRSSPITPPETPGPDVITIAVGLEKRLFAAHKEILCVSSFFATACSRAPLTQPGLLAEPLDLPDEQPEVFSCVLEYLYRGDYFPRLTHNMRRDSWELGDAGTDRHGQSHGATVFIPEMGAEILRDTAVYCAADKYGLEMLKRLALRKQGLHTGIQCHTILTSARFAYANTPDSESKLRAHYLALIIRSRDTFKRSGTMQMEMEQGGKLFFDLFVAMCNFIDDTIAAQDPKLALPAA
ncbi:BTB/POZ domain-containing protein [Aspergillus affinis]|uniref:BTB/POZ domain-containing protein n=1 Tax=Aspergillus affinis TaxID=1070780 RepID=UPI0022FE95DB|nr:uncharacterized protein KD926_004583 [Aspergillus affinis]KAI9043080.1 hypothetical protein KD926_004583 [Aspergillus affinis]